MMVNFMCQLGLGYGAQLFSQIAAGCCCEGGFEK